MRRHLMLTGLLGAAVGVPYVVSKGPEAFPDLGSWSTTESATQAEHSTEFAPLDLPDVDRVGPDSEIYEQPAPLAGPRVHSLAEVLRMDITKEWVYQRWARKSTGLADPQFFGVRVPLVTGTGLGDLAGSLTYYFGRTGGIERIEFRGTTADTSQLISLLTSRYAFRPSLMAPAGEQWFEVHGSRGVESYLRTRPESVLWGNQPHQSNAVDLVLNRPGSGHVAKDAMPTIDSLLPELAEDAGPDGSTQTAADSENSDSGSPYHEELGFRGRRPTPRWPN